jgi:hypothetical protein
VAIKGLAQKPSKTVENVEVNLVIPGIKQAVIVFLANPILSRELASQSKIVAVALEKNLSPGWKRYNHLMALPNIP